MKEPFFIFCCPWPHYDAFLILRTPHLLATLSLQDPGLKDANNFMTVSSDADILFELDFGGGLQREDIKSERNG
jgi:hypothetical protein